MTPIEFTGLASSVGPLTKRISLGPNGDLVVDDSACNMWQGTAVRVLVGTMTEVAAYIGACKHNQAIAVGALDQDRPALVNIVTAKNLAKMNGTAGPDTISRTSQHIKYVPGKPALALLDYDTKAMPKALAERIEALGGFWQALLAVVPELKDGGRVTRNSTSSRIERVDTGAKLKGSSGVHVFLLVQNGGDVERFLKALHDRCWLCGFGWMMVGAGGQFLERSIVDRMVYAAERLVFEGEPVLVEPLKQDARHRAPVAHEGEPTNTAAICPKLDDAETTTLKTLKDAELKRLAPASVKVRAKFVKEQVARITARTECSDADAKLAAEQMCEGILLPDVVLAFDDDDLAGATVADILANPERFVGKTLADPLEGIDYGKCKAKVMQRPNGALWINSFAHGRAIYELQCRQEDVGPEEVAAEIERLSWLTGAAYASQRIAFAKRLTMGVGDLDKAIKAEQAKRRHTQEQEALAQPGPLPGETKWPFGIVSEPGGLYAHTGADAVPVWLCAPIEVLGEGRDAEGEGWALHLKWHDGDGRAHCWAMPARAVMGQSGELEGALVERGLRVSVDLAARTQLRHALNGVRSGARVTLISRPGWHTPENGDSAYVLLNGETVGATSEALVLKTPVESASQKTAALGTLKGWQDEIAAKAAGNSFAALALCVAFAGPLLEPLGESSGGFHLYGRSKAGKTLIMRMGISAWGSPKKSGLLRDWRSTANGMEAAAEEANDGFLALDEIHQAEPKEVIGAVYLLSNEGGKQRLDRTATSRARRTWRTLILSTGEIDVAGIAAKAGQKLPAGADVRLPSISVDGQEMWPNLHGAKTADELMGKLQQALTRNYGSAMRVFLDRLTTDLKDPISVIIPRIEGLRSQFNAMLPTDADPQVRDVARRFALVTLAGQLAVEWGLLPWQRDEPMKAATAVLNQWLGRRDGAGSAEESQHVKVVRAFLAEHGSSRLVTIKLGKGSSGPDRWFETYPERTIQYRAGFRRVFDVVEGIVPGDEYLIFPDAWAALCAASSIDPVETGRTLLNAGFLSGPADKRGFQRLFRVPGLGPTKFYAIRSTIFGASGNADAKGGDAGDGV